MGTRMIFPNIPVKDLKRSMDFFGHLGFTFNEKFTDDKAACMVVNETAFIMLLTDPFFRTFTTKKLVDTLHYTELIMAVSADSREQVDSIAARALEMGATETRTEDLGFMYTRGFADPDGHLWEFFWMDEHPE